MPLPAARPDRRRLLRVVGVGLVGIAVGVGATLAAHGLGGADRAASVQRLDLPAGGVAPAAPTPGEATARGGRPCGRAALPRGRAAGDAATAYGLLDRAGRKRYPSPARFERAQADRAVVTAVRVGRERGPGRPGPTSPSPCPTRRPSTRSPGWSPPGRSRCGGPAARTALAGRGRPGVGPCRPAQRRPRPRGDRLGPAPARLRPPGGGQPAGRGRAVRAGRPGRAALPGAGPLDGGRPRGLRRRRRAGGLCRRLRPRGRLLGPAGAGPGPAHRFHVVVGPLGDAWRVLGTDPDKAR